MELTENDIAKIQQILLDAGETVRKRSIELNGQILSFRLLGTDADGSAAINALWNAGLNGYSDGDLDTVENKTVWSEGAESALVTMTIAEGGLWVG